MRTATFFTPVQEDIQRVEALMRAQADDHHPELRAALEHLLSSGGKRIRPAMGLLIGRMLGGDTDLMIKMAAAVELLHTATLVHDDLIDGALLRRGIPTLNSRCSSAATVLTGDFIFARAARLAAETDHLSLMRFFAETLATIANGEITQFFSSRVLIGREDYYNRIYAKTASLFEMTARAAAMLSPVNDATVEAMRNYGYQVGMAFQIVDDILDFTGEQARMGKPVGSDLLHGLVTLPTLYYIESHPDDPDIRLLAKDDHDKEKRMEQLVEAIRASQAIPQSMHEAKQYVERALQLLSSHHPGKNHSALEDLAKYIVDRQM